MLNPVFESGSHGDTCDYTVVDLALKHQPRPSCGGERPRARDARSRRRAQPWDAVSPSRTLVWRESSPYAGWFNVNFGWRRRLWGRPLIRMLGGRRPLVKPQLRQSRAQCLPGPTSSGPEREFGIDGLRFQMWPTVLTRACATVRSPTSLALPAQSVWARGMRSSCLWRPVYDQPVDGR